MTYFLRRFLPSVGMTGVCGWREEGKKQRRSRCFFPSLYNSTQSHSERSEESPCDSWHSDKNKGIMDGVIINHRLLRELFENNGFKTQIMLPFQGENGLPFLSAQGVAIGLRYAALSGRKWFGDFIRPRRCHWAGLFCPFRAKMAWRFFLRPERATYPSPTATPWVMNN